MTAAEAIGSCECGCGRTPSIAPYTNARLGWIRGRPKRFVVGHAGRKRGPRYLLKDCGYTSPCWVWQLGLDTYGYAQVTIEGKTQKAHRWYYEQAKGPVPEGLTLDHLCRIRHCVNPDHLEPVTRGENQRRGKHIKLSFPLAREIRDLADAGWDRADIGLAYGVHKDYVKLVVRGKRWCE